METRTQNWRSICMYPNKKQEEFAKRSKKLMDHVLKKKSGEYRKDIDSWRIQQAMSYRVAKEYWDNLRSIGVIQLNSPKWKLGPQAERLCKEIVTHWTQQGITL